MIRPIDYSSAYSRQAINFSQYKELYIPSSHAGRFTWLTIRVSPQQGDCTLGRSVHQQAVDAFWSWSEQTIVDLQVQHMRGFCSRSKARTASLQLLPWGTGGVWSIVQDRHSLLLRLVTSNLLQCLDQHRQQSPRHLHPFHYREHHNWPWERDHHTGLSGHRCNSSSMCWHTWRDNTGTSRPDLKFRSTTVQQSQLSSRAVRNCTQRRRTTFI